MEEFKFPALKKKQSFRKLNYEHESAVLAGLLIEQGPFPALSRS